MFDNIVLEIYYITTNNSKQRIYLCMYVCMYACMHACMHACMYVCMLVDMHLRTYIRIHALTTCSDLTYRMGLFYRRSLRRLKNQADE